MSAKGKQDSDSGKRPQLAKKRARTPSPTLEELREIHRQKKGAWKPADDPRVETSFRLNTGSGKTIDFETVFFHKAAGLRAVSKSGDLVIELKVSKAGERKIGAAKGLVALMTPRSEK